MNHAKILSAAFFIQAHLDERLNLQRLANLSGVSPHHFHREFQKITGEPPARFVQRLRVEKAALSLILHDQSVLNIALECGFKNPETFTRAFSKHFNSTPAAYRKQKRFAVASNNDHHLDEPPAHYEISKTKIVQLQQRPIAFLTAYGPYENGDIGLWDQLQTWSDLQNFPAERVCFGIAHDAPSICPPEKLRFDACISVPTGTTSSGHVHVGKLPARHYGLTTHVGAYHTLTQAYPKIFHQTQNLKNTQIDAGPIVELYHDQTISNQRHISTTDIYLPVNMQH